MTLALRARGQLVISPLHARQTTPEQQAQLSDYLSGSGLGKLHQITHRPYLQHPYPRPTSPHNRRHGQGWCH